MLSHIRISEAWKAGILGQKNRLSKIHTTTSSSWISDSAQHETKSQLFEAAVVFLFLLRTSNVTKPQDSIPQWPSGRPRLLLKPPTVPLRCCTISSLFLYLLTRLWAHELPHESIHARWSLPRDGSGSLWINYTNVVLGNCIGYRITNGSLNSFSLNIFVTSQA
jgi:hypothetical protein